MLSIVVPIVYLAYTATVCLISIKCIRWWLKLIVTAIGIWGLAMLPSVSYRLAELFSSLFSLGLTVGVYVLLFVVFIRCMFPHHRRHFF